MTACNGLLLRKFRHNGLTNPPPAHHHLLQPSDHVQPSCNRRCTTPVWDSLQLCTEGLGFESSSDDAEDVKMEMGKEKWEHVEVRERDMQKQCIDGDGDVMKRGRLTSEGKEFPPPISCIGQGGRPCVCFETHREAGRVVLREVWLPVKEVLQARREGGRLMLSFVQMNGEVFEEHDRECEDDDEDDDDVKDQEKSDEDEIL